MDKDIKTLNQEFSDQFDVYYNNISSNQAPGLDPYEKSLFLTRAQDDVVKSYFSPYLNKVQSGYDGNERRQIDFSMITKSKVYEDYFTVHFTVSETSTNDQWDDTPFKVNTLSPLRSLAGILNIDTTNKQMTIAPTHGTQPLDEFKEVCVQYLSSSDTEYKNGTIELSETSVGFYSNKDFDKKFNDPVFDLRSNTRSITLSDDIMIPINEYVEVLRDDQSYRLIIDPITYTEYSRVMSKPYKRPIKNKAWRLIDNADNNRRSELIIGPCDTLIKYVIRYVKRPRAIILDDLGTSRETTDVTIDGKWKAQSCELDPILYPEIIQRAVELAWAAYKEPSLTNQLALGQASQTNIGAVQTSGRRGE